MDREIVCTPTTEAEGPAASGTEKSENSIQKKSGLRKASERFRNFNERHPRFYLLAAFLIPFFLTWAVYIAMECYPFGQHSVLVLDLNGQYVSFFETLRDLIVHGGSIAYSWERALGGEFMGIFAYYLASPLSLIVALFPKRMITEALLVIILTKAGLCGLSMAFYLDVQYPTKKINTVIFSTMYAMTAYAVIQAHNTMWIDELVLLPLLTLGIDRLISHRKMLLYTACLAMSMLVNFYIGYMMCIYTLFAFFFIYCYNSAGGRNNVTGEKLHFLKSLGRVAVATAIGLCIAAVVWLPTYYSLTFGKTTFSTGLFDFSEGFSLSALLHPTEEYAQRFDFLDFIVKLYPGSYDTVRPTGLPCVYSGVLTLILLPVYFISPKVKVREKLLGAAGIAFFLVSMNVSVFDIIWHGFQKPNWLNYRYSFMLCFLMILLAYRAFATIGEIDFKWVWVSTGVFTVLIFVIQKMEYEFVDDFRCVWISVLFLIVITAALHCAAKKTLKQFSAVTLCIAVCVEMFASGLLNLTDLDADVHYTSRTSYVSYMDRLSPIINRVKASDDSFYRMEKSVHRKTNDPMAFGYNGVSNSTSTLNASVIALLHQLGLQSKSHWSKYVGGNPVTDSLLGIKYMIYEDEESAPLYDQIDKDENNTLYAYENPYVLSVAFAVNDRLRTLDFDDFDTPFELLNAILGSMLGEKQVEVFKSCKITDIDYDNCDVTYVVGHKKYSPEIDGRAAKIYYEFKTRLNDPLYCYFPSDYPRECKLIVDGEEYGMIMGNDTHAVKYLGYREADMELSASLTLNDDVMYMANGGTYFWQLDTALFEEVMAKLSASLFQVEDYSDTMLSGTVTAAEGCTTLFTTIPYDEGWVVKIDGETVEIPEKPDVSMEDEDGRSSAKDTEPDDSDYFRIGGALLGVSIPEGTHSVTFEYHSPYIRNGSVLCAAGLFGFVVMTAITVVTEKRKIKKQVLKEKIEK